MKYIYIHTKDIARRLINMDCLLTGDDAFGGVY